MPVPEEIHNWVEKAEEDYEVAISLVRKRRRAVHCVQQFTS